MENEKLMEAIRAIIREELKTALGGTTSEKYLTVDQAVVYTNYSKDTLYTYAHKRIIESVNKGKGNKLLFRKSDLDTWLNKKKSVIYTTKELREMIKNRV